MEFTKRKCVTCSIIFVPRFKTTTKFCSHACVSIYGNKKKNEKLKSDPQFKKTLGKKISFSKLGPKNPMWKEDVGYKSLHEWVNIHKPRPDLCEECRIVPPYDLANKGVYNRNFDNWEYLCRRCHMIKDGRLAKFTGKDGEKNVTQYQTRSISGT